MNYVNTLENFAGFIVKGATKYLITVESFKCIDNQLSVSQGEFLFP